MFKRRQQQEEVALSDAESVSSSTSSSSGDSTLHENGKITRMNKILLLSSRGINSRQRHLLTNLTNIIAHSKKENKFDSKSDLFELNELAELDGCTHCVFFEARKPSELFMWMAKCPSGPSARFHVLNIHTAEEMNTVGNFCFGTRPLLSFDPSLSGHRHGEIIQQLLTDVFNVPAGHRKGDRHQFYDHLYHFAYLDGKIWFRNYQIVEDAHAEVAIDGMSLVEIGPRFILNPIKIFEGSFRGKVLWSNETYLSPAEMRADIKRSVGSKYANKQAAHSLSLIRKKESIIPAEETYMDD